MIPKGIPDVPLQMLLNLQNVIGSMKSNLSVNLNELYK